MLIKATALGLACCLRDRSKSKRSYSSMSKSEWFTWFWHWQVYYYYCNFIHLLLYKKWRIHNKSTKHPQATHSAEAAEFKFPGCCEGCQAQGFGQSQGCDVNSWGTSRILRGVSMGRKRWLQQIDCGKLIWNLQINQLKRKIIFETSIFGIFQGVKALKKVYTMLMDILGLTRSRGNEAVLKRRSLHQQPQQWFHL